MTVASEDLGDLFGPVIALYETTEAGVHYDHHTSDAIDVGSPLAERLNDDWRVFADVLVDGSPSMEDLLGDILRASNDPKEGLFLDVGALWSRQDDGFAERTPREAWDEFAGHLRAGGLGDERKEVAPQF